jgi:hypothetical protein
MIALVVVGAVTILLAVLGYRSFGRVPFTEEAEVNYRRRGTHG